MLSLILYLTGFVLMWVGAGFALTPIGRVAKSLHVSAFNVSFLVLGIATSMSEFSVGINAIIGGDPEIFIGNLLGASLILFLFVIPMLAIFGNRLQIDHELKGVGLPLVLGVVALPSLLAFDGIITHIDAGIAIAGYLFMVSIVQRRSSLKDKLFTRRLAFKQILKQIVTALVGVGLIFFGSKLVVTKTLYYATVLEVSPFLLSLLLISFGTNLPEIAVGVRSLFLRKKNLAFADYVGSSAFNTFLFGFLALFVAEPVKLGNSYWIPLLTILLGLSVFYVFAKSKYTLSKHEAVGLIFLYTMFLIAEVLK